MRIRRIAIASAATVLVAGSSVAGAAVAAVPSAAPSAVRSDHTITKLPARITLPVGHRATLTLQTNITTGTRWIVSGTPCCTKSGKAMAKVSKGTYTAPVTTLVGAPGTTSWTITALRPGTGYVTVVTRPAGVLNTMQDEEVGRVKVTVTP